MRHSKYREKNLHREAIRANCLKLKMFYIRKNYMLEIQKKLFGINSWRYHETFHSRINDKVYL